MTSRPRISSVTLNWGVGSPAKVRQAAVSDSLSDHELMVRKLEM